jgi:hypothetical protein
MPIGGAQQYLANYNSYTLPGYVQSEQFDSSMNIAAHYADYADGSESEQVGLQNKVLNLVLKVWECDYATAKNEVQKAATILRSKRKGWAPLYVHYSDRYYWAMTPKIGFDKTAGSSVRTLDYQVQFECKPWLISVSGHTLTGTSSNTDTVGRTIDNGGWTPATVTLTGTNITVSGYTESGDFAGFISVSGAVTNLVIDSEAFTAELANVNANDRMKWADYRMYVGPGKTYFVSTGASSMTIQYNDRWYL